MTGCKTPFFFSTFKIQLKSRDDLSTAGIKNIFTATGNHIKKLTLHLDYSSKKMTFERSSLMTDLQKLLISQGPNLEFVKINFELPSSWKWQILYSSFGHENAAATYIPQNENELMLPKLKVFVVKGLIPSKFFSNVMRASANLQFLGASFELDFSGVMEYFMEADGRDKIHLLKDLRLQLHPRSWIRWEEVDFNKIKLFLTEYNENLELEAFELKVSLRNQFDKILNYSMLPIQRIANLVIQILESNSGTLKKLTVAPTEWFDGLIIPRLLNLQEICFDFVGSRNTTPAWLALDLALLPRGINMNHSFPNVSCLTFLSCSLDSMYEYVRKLEMTQPFQSVRYIIVKDWGLNSSYDMELIPVDFYPIFPNLVSISHKYSTSISLKFGRSMIVLKNK